MKLEIYKEPEPEPEPVAEEEKITRLRLVPGGHAGEVRVIVVDEKGENCGGGVLIEICPEGLVRRKHLTTNAGFPLDDSGTIKELEPF